MRSQDNAPEPVQSDKLSSAQSQQQQTSREDQTPIGASSQISSNFGYTKKRSLEGKPAGNQRSSSKDSKSK